MDSWSKAWLLEAICLQKLGITLAGLVLLVRICVVSGNHLITVIMVRLRPAVTRRLHSFDISENSVEATGNRGSEVLEQSRTF